MTLAFTAFWSCSLFSGNNSDLIPVEIDGKWGYINTKGEYQINPQFESAEYFSDGLARVVSGGKVGYINTKGQYAINAQYEDGTSFEDGVAFVVTSNSYPICINTKGKEVFTMKNTTSCFRFSDGVAAFIDKSGKYGIVNKDGKVICPARWTDITRFKEGLAAVLDSNKVGYIDKSGNMVITPQFSNADVFSDGLAAISNGTKWGFVNSKGEYAINPQFDAVGSFHEGLCLFQNGSLYGYIDKAGNYAINPQFDDARNFSNGLAPFKNGDQWGYVDKSGKIVINPQFSEARPFDGKYAVVKSGERYGLIDAKGKFVVNPQFDDIAVNNKDIQYNRDYVNSTFYDASGFIEGLFKDSKSLMSLLDKFKKGTTLKGVANCSPFDECEVYSSYSIRYDGGAFNRDDEIRTDYVKFYFEDDVYEYSYDYYYYSSNRSYKWASKLDYIQCEFYLSGTANGKGSAVSNALSEKINSLYHVEFKNYEDIVYGFSSANNKGYLISYDDNSITLKIFLTKERYNSIISDFETSDNSSSRRYDDDCVIDTPAVEEVIEEWVI